jgi:1,4-dihydroxy-2-naphthoyl-CoA hydrolase
VVTLADTACGYGCLASLPGTAAGFTTIELKANFLGTVEDGPVLAEARLHHAGRRTQVWDAVVAGEQAGRTIALFRCTQMILYPQAARGLPARATGMDKERDLDAR